MYMKYVLQWTPDCTT